MSILVKATNIGDITAALCEQLKQWPGIAALSAAIERSERLNEQPGRCPWIGVYRDRVELTIKILGYGPGFREQRVTLVIAAQEADASSGEKCEDRLEALLKEILSAVLTDTTLRGTVREIPDLNVKYAEYKMVGTEFMQTAAVYMTVVVPVQIENVN